MEPRANILLVHDDLSVRQALGEALALEEYQVAFAATSNEAQRRLREQGPNEINAVLLDLSLGHEYGWAVFNSLTKLKPMLPVITLSATRDHEIPLAARRQCVAIMAKPLDVARLVEILHSLTIPRRQPVPAQDANASAAVREHSNG
jgi:DNA-binding NtrC family response regulator